MAASNSNARAKGAAETDFAFTKDIKMNKPHQLRQTTTRFMGVKDGLPELIKNAKDQYSRLGIFARRERQIVVIADTERHRLGVLDFAGAAESDFEGWSIWSDPEANRKSLAVDIEGGNGNGGKSFMVWGATEESFFESCYLGKRTKMGFRNNDDSKRYLAGVVREGGVGVVNLNEPNPKVRLEAFLSQLEATPASLPKQAVEAFEQRKAFSGISLIGVSEWDGRQRRKVRRLAEETIPEIIQNHGQTAISVETCEIWVVVDGVLVTSEPIAPLKLDPHPSFETPREFGLPDILVDPREGEAVNVRDRHESAGKLVLRTSAKQLQMSEDTKARNVIRVLNGRNNVANWPLHDLGIQITSVSYIYGELLCPSLEGIHLAGPDRNHLNDTPLTRALREWTRQKAKELAEDLQRAKLSEDKPRDREQARATLHGIRNLMRQFLESDQQGEQETGDQQGTKGKGNKGSSYKRNTNWGVRLDQLVLEPGRDEIAMCVGTTIPLISQCLEVQDDGTMKPVRHPPLVLKSDQMRLIKGSNGDQLTPVEAGTAEIWLETADGLMQSNKVKCVFLVATDVHVTLPEDPLLQGQKLKLPLTFQTTAGPRDDLLIEARIDEPLMGQIGRSGRFTAGGKEGQATLRIRFDETPERQRTFTIDVSADRVTPTGTQGGTSNDIPEILLCGEPAPHTEELPPESRTIAPDVMLSTIVEDPTFSNVVWINPLSKESMRVRSQRGGPTGAGGIGTKAFGQFIALKCFDILKRLRVRQSFKGKPMTEYEFTQAFTIAEMECVSFIDAAWELTDDLVKRTSETNDGDQSE